MRERLAIDELTDRFCPEPLLDSQLLGQFEGAFLPCTFWLANLHRLAGDEQAGQAILDGIDKVAGPLGLLAEAIDARDRRFGGNSPLVFSQTAHLRAGLAIGPPGRQRSS
jgi:GH15 family glucan-1,4-alpha-glucosidase